MTDIVDQVRNAVHKFEHQTACGIIAVETLAVQREVLIKLCDEIERLRTAVKEENAACAKMCDEARAARLAEQIRARGNT